MDLDLSAIDNKNLYSDNPSSNFLFNKGNSDGEIKICDDVEKIINKNDNLVLDLNGKAIGDKEVEYTKVNFNKITSIGKGAFEKLVCNNSDIEFLFASDMQMKIDEEAFGLDVQQIKSISSYSGNKISLELYQNSFLDGDFFNNIEKIENIKIFLAGEWDKEVIKIILGKLNDSVIQRGTKFKISDKFSKAESNLLEDDKVSEEFKKCVLEKKADNKSDVTDSTDVKQPKEDESKIIEEWDDLDDSVKEEIAKSLKTKFKEEDVLIKIDLDGRKLNGTKVDKPSIVEKISFIGKTLDAIGSVFAEQGLENIKSNRTKAKDYIKKEIINLVTKAEEIDKIKEFIEDKEKGIGIECQVNVNNPKDDFKAGENFSIKNELPIGMQTIEEAIKELNGQISTKQKSVRLDSDMYLKLCRSVQLKNKEYKKAKDKEGCEICKRVAEILQKVSRE